MAHAAPHSPAGDGSWFNPKSETGRMILEYPWENTPLGPIAAWPSHLRTTVNLVMDAGAPMALIWGREHVFLYNDGYAAIIQDKHPKALGAPAREIFPEAWEVLAPLFARTMAGHALLSEDLVVDLTRAGVTRPAYFSFSYNPVRNERNGVDGFIAVVMESTSRVVREQERAGIFDTVLSAINDFAYAFDRDGRITFANKALLDLWGLSLDQVVGKNFTDLKYPEAEAAKLQRQIQEVIDRKITVSDETAYESPTGVRGVYEYILKPVLGPGGEVRVVAGSTRDVTLRKKQEVDALETAKAKDNFLATLSHELRTPLNPALMLATENAANPDLPPAVRDDFQAITDSISVEARLIDDLLDLSRIAHHKVLLNVQVHDLHPVLVKAIETVTPDAHENRIEIISRLEANPALVSADQVRLHQILNNLLRNAVKFTPAGGCVTVTTRNSKQSGRIVVEIADTGIGLTELELAKVFMPFAQGHHADEGTNAFGGLGLGLAIARQLAELHGGSVHASSSGRDRGATFVVELPAAAAGSRPSDATLPPSPARKPMGRGRVLLVEDHTASRHVLARLLTSRQLEVVQAASAGEALERAKEQSFDLVISDLGLPDLSGHDLMRALKATYGARGIALSGFGTEQDISLSMEAGFLAHLTKPVEAAALDEALQKYLRPASA